MSEDPRVLPIAPRPMEGELLSSWQRRVACRYGLSSDGLAVLLGAKPDDGRITGFAERDFAPDAGQVRAWARAARLEEGALQALVLSAGSRPQGCYVGGEGRGYRKVPFARRFAWLVSMTTPTPVATTIYAGPGRSPRPSPAPDMDAPWQRYARAA